MGYLDKLMLQQLKKLIEGMRDKSEMFVDEFLNTQEFPHNIKEGVLSIYKPEVKQILMEYNNLMYSQMEKIKA